VLQSVTRAALDVGAACIELYVFRRNVRAIQAYQRAGFKVAREELTDLGGGVVYDDFVMAKEIKSPKAV
jgi:RimJ/RimL family protein N-acetyltransferase